jgi:hypothetical protein
MPLALAQLKTAVKRVVQKLSREGRNVGEGKIRL